MYFMRNWNNTKIFKEILIPGYKVGWSYVVLNKDLLPRAISSRTIVRAFYLVAFSNLFHHYAYSQTEFRFVAKGNSMSFLVPFCLLSVPLQSVTFIWKLLILIPGKGGGS